MKTQAEINLLVTEFEARYGLKIPTAQQGSTGWLQTKLGVLSASNASTIVAKRDSQGRATYMAELVGQVCTGVVEELNAKALDWGRQHEDAARSSYEFANDVKVSKIPFVFRDNTFREGCSPDGLVSLSKGAEIKCPFDTANYIKFFVDDKIKSEYQWQTQYTLRVMNADEWDFVQYDPRMKRSPLKVLTVKRDAEKQKAFDDLVPQFIYDMDLMLEKIGIKFGDHWTMLKETGQAQ